MIIADIVEAVKKVPSGDLQEAIRGIRKAYLVLPAQSKKEMLSEFSNLEYVYTAAANAKGMEIIDKTPGIFETYADSKK